MPKLLFSLIFSALLITAPLTFAASDDERAQAAAETRQGLLKVVVSYFGPILGMVRQQLPYDGDVVQKQCGTNRNLATHDPPRIPARHLGF